MLVPHAEHRIAPRPIAHPLRKIFARIRWALTLALLQLALPRLLGRGGNHGLLAAALPIPTILFAALLATGCAGPVTPARLHPTPALRRATTLFVAITDLRMRRCEPPFAPLQKTTTASTRMGRNLLPERREMMKCRWAQGRVDPDGQVSESSWRLAPRRFYPLTQPPYLRNPGPRSNHRALARATPRFWYPSKTLLTEGNATRRSPTPGTGC